MSFCSHKLIFKNQSQRIMCLFESHKKNFLTFKKNFSTLEMVSTPPVPYEFIFATLMFAALLVYSIFYSPAVNGFLLSKIVNLFVGKDEYINIGKNVASKIVLRFGKKITNVRKFEQMFCLVFGNCIWLLIMFCILI